MLIFITTSPSISTGWMRTVWVTDDGNQTTIPGGSIWLAALLTFLWLAANSSFVFETLTTGVLISAILAYLFTTGKDPRRV
jgi:hypothetical protein